MNHRRTGRRQFLKTVGLAVGAPYVITSAALGAQGRPPASERVVMGSIGCGMRSDQDVNGFLRLPEAQMVALCDVVRDHAESARERVNRRYGNNDCKIYNDFRDLLARDDIDAVSIATPEHWHALMTIEACKQGKDIFCEKPESLTIKEGRAMVEAARRWDRVVSGGSQRVLGDYGDWPRLVRGGAIGEVQEVFIRADYPSGPCRLPAQPVPPGVDWDLWIGPAPWRPFNAILIHGGFRPFRDYAGGGMTDWGAHLLGASLFAVGLHKTGPVEIIPPDGRDHPYLTWRFANGMRIHNGGSPDITYKGTAGELPGKHGPVAGPVDVETYHGKGLQLLNEGNSDGAILADFLHCVKTREVPFRDIESAHRTATVCHLGNIAWWLGRPLKWDPVNEQFLGDEEANRWHDRPKREAWAL